MYVDVISTVGPIGDGDESCRLLRSCYDNCLDIVGHADEIRSIAFPGISTGVYGRLFVLYLPPYASMVSDVSSLVRYQDSLWIRALR